MEQETFDRALIELGKELPGYFRRRVSDFTAAEDLAQETLLKAYRSRATLREQSSLAAWLYRIAHITMIDFFRRKRRWAELPCEPGEQASTEDSAMAVICCSARCYLETLPAAYRHPVYLADYENLPHADVARQLGLSLAAAKSRIRRGKLMVRRLMEARCHFEYDSLGHVIGYQLRETEAGRGES